MADHVLTYATPTAKDVDPEGILAFLDAIKQEGTELHNFMLYKEDAIIAEGYWHPYASSYPHMQHSAAKSWTATAMGFAFAEGLAQLDDQVISFFPDQLPAQVSANLEAMTIKDLLTMRTGHRTGVSGGEWRGTSTSWIEAFLREPVEDVPGQHFIYSSATSYMISAIVTKLTGLTVRDYLEPRLFKPLGMKSVRWDTSPEGVSTGGNGITCTMLDVMKFGIVHLQSGMWKGEQILPKGWVGEATRNHVDEVWMGRFDGKRFGSRTDRHGIEKREGYGYQWWVAPHGGFYASGNYGQLCLVLPEQQTVIGITGGLRPRDPALMKAIWNHLYPALGKQGFPAKNELLQTRLRSLSMPQVPGKAHASLSRDVDGKIYEMQKNDDCITHIRFEFSKDSCVFSLTDHRGKHSITVGLGSFIEGDTTMTGNVLHHEYQPDLMTVVARGVWLDEQRFQMTWHFVETAFTDTVLCTFDKQTLLLKRSVNTNAGPLECAEISGSVVGPESGCFQ